MKLTKILFLTGLICCTVSTSEILAQKPHPTTAASKMQLIYDGQIEFKPTGAGKPSAAEMKILTGEVQRAAQEFWGDACGDNGGGEVSVTDFASGSFTRPNARQRIFTYSFCETGHEFANDGIVVLENGKIVVHIAYAGGQEDGLRVLPDINRNGTSEILISGSGTYQGFTVEGVLLLEISANGVTSFGSVQTSEDSCASGLESEHSEAYKIYVQPQNNPVFYREQFSAKTCGAKLVRIGAAKRFALEKIETKYEVLN